MNNKILGNKGEKIAQQYLKKHKYRILDTNYRCSFGELDIVATIDNILVIVEVKTRLNDNYGKPREAINYTKQQHIVRSATLYLHQKKITGVQVRFDCIEVDATGEVTHLVDAFRP